MRRKQHIVDSICILFSIMPGSVLRTYQRRIVKGTGLEEQAGEAEDVQDRE